ncbi:2OG-Fe(II) oxygenase [Microbacterium deminutum]|uniref:2OG-Fe(II) oxygenase n=1 Tax=Microbacterium deminutum TaxID=344164 RepID=UPI0031D74AD7
MRSLVVDSQVVTSAGELSEAWQDLGQLIVSPAYRARLGSVVDRDLDGLRLDASLCRYPPGCSLIPHTDREQRDTTHVVYLNREWRREWGGMLRILRSDDLEDVIEEVLPTLPTSVVMVRSDRSWHAVTPVASGVTAERLSLLVHASRPDVA